MATAQTLHIGSSSTLFRWLSFATLSLFLYSCKELVIISKITNQQLVLPTELLQVSNGFVTCKDLSDISSEHRIVFLFDENECMTCAVKHIPSWNSYIIDKFGGSIEPIFIMESSEAITDLVTMSKIYDGLTIYVDTDCLIFHKNNFIPADIKYHTFLVDKDWVVTCVGNPFGNEKLTSLYKELTMRQ